MNYYQLILTVIMLGSMLLFTWLKSPKVSLLLAIPFCIAILIQIFRMFREDK